MKKVIKIILLILVMLPFFVNASVCDRANTIIDDYFLNPTYANANTYLKSENENGKVIGELLSENNYNLTKKGNEDTSSYLYDGYNFCATNGTSNIIIPSNQSLNAKMRIVVTINPTVKVIGSGSRNNPWIFNNE